MKRKAGQVGRVRTMSLSDGSGRGMASLEPALGPTLPCRAAWNATKGSGVWPVKLKLEHCPRLRQIDAPRGQSTPSARPRLMFSSPSRRFATPGGLSVSGGDT